MADLSLEVCISVGAGQKWDRVEMADLSFEVCTSGGAGQKWDRVETADEPNLNLAVLCLWGQDRSGTEVWVLVLLVCLSYIYLHSGLHILLVFWH